MTEHHLNNPSVSFDHTVNGDVKIILRSRLVSRTDDGNPVVVVLDAAHALSVLHAFANATHYSATHAMEQFARGDCATCSNTRMVTVKKKDREMSEHCPDCIVPRDQRTRMPAMPIIGGGLRGVDG